MTKERYVKNDIICSDIVWDLWWFVVIYKKYDDIDSLIKGGSPRNKQSKGSRISAKLLAKWEHTKSNKKVLSEDGIWLIWKALGEDELKIRISYNKENVKAFMMKIQWMDSFSNNGFLNLFLLMDETYNKKGWQVKTSVTSDLVYRRSRWSMHWFKETVCTGNDNLKARYNQVRNAISNRRQERFLNEDDVQRKFMMRYCILEQHSKKEMTDSN